MLSERLRIAIQCAAESARDVAKVLEAAQVGAERGVDLASVNAYVQEAVNRIKQTESHIQEYRKDAALLFLDTQRTHIDQAIDMTLSRPTMYAQTAEALVARVLALLETREQIMCPLGTVRDELNLVQNRWLQFVDTFSINSVGEASAVLKQFVQKEREMS